MFRVTSSKAMALITAIILCLAGISLAEDIERHFKTLTLLRDTQTPGEAKFWKNLCAECRAYPAYDRPTIDIFEVGDISNTYVGTFAMTDFFTASLGDEITFENVTLSYDDTWRKRNVEKLLAKEGSIKVMLHNVATPKEHEPHTNDGNPITCLVSSVGKETTAIHDQIRHLQQHKDAIERGGMAVHNIKKVHARTNLTGNLQTIRASIRNLQEQKDAIGYCGRESTPARHLWFQEKIVLLQKQEKELTDAVRTIDEMLMNWRKQLRSF